MKKQTLTLAIAILGGIALLAGCKNTECTTCTMGANEVEYCKGDFASDNEYRGQVLTTSNMGYDCTEQ